MIGARVCVGAIAGAFGVKGEVRLKSFCSDPATIADYTPLTTEDGAHHFDLTITRQIQNGFAARLSGISTREQAEKFKGTLLYAERTQLPRLPDDEFYHADLIGLEVYDTGGTNLGAVLAVHNHGAGDMLEIRKTDSNATVLLPFTLDAVPTVDLTSGRMIVDPPDGIFEKAET